MLDEIQNQCAELAEHLHQVVHALAEPETHPQWIPDELALLESVSYAYLLRHSYQKIHALAVQQDPQIPADQPVHPRHLEANKAIIRRKAESHISQRLTHTRTRANVRALINTTVTVHFYAPELLMQLSCGKLSVDHFNQFAQALTSLPVPESPTAPEAPEYEEAKSHLSTQLLELSEKAHSLTGPQLRDSVRSLRESCHPQPGGQRHQHAYQRRNVSISAADDGMAYLHAYLNASDATFIQHRLNEAYARSKAHGDLAGRSPAQVSADHFVWLLRHASHHQDATAGQDNTAVAAGVQPALTVPDMAEHTGPELSAQQAPISSGTSKVERAPVISQGTNTTVMLTLSLREAIELGLSISPEYRPFFDATYPELKATMDANYHHYSTPAHRRRSKHPPHVQASRSRAKIIGSSLEISATDSAELLVHAEIVRAIITDEITHKPLAWGSKRYRVPPWLRELVVFRDRTCRAPDCQESAQYAELDHTVPWASGGKTSYTNLAALCPRHHREKTERWVKMHARPEEGDSVLSHHKPSGEERITYPAMPLDPKAWAWAQTHQPGKAEH